MKKIVLLCLLIFLSLNSAYSQPFNLNKLNYWDNIITEKSNIKIPLASQYVDVSEKENEVCKQLIDSFESQSNRFVFGKIGHDWETADFVWHFYLPGRKFDPNSLEVIKLREIGFYDKIKDSVYTLSLKQKVLNEIIKKAKEYRVTTEFEIPPTTTYVDYTNVEYSFGHSTVVYSFKGKAIKKIRERYVCNGILKMTFTDSFSDPAGVRERVQNNHKLPKYFRDFLIKHKECGGKPYKFIDNWQWNISENYIGPIL